MEDIQKAQNTSISNKKKQKNNNTWHTAIKKRRKKVQKEFETIVNSIIQLRAGYECIIWFVRPEDKMFLRPEDTISVWIKVQYKLLSEIQSATVNIEFVRPIKFIFVDFLLSRTL